MNPGPYVDVALAFPSAHDSFQYAVPEPMAGEAEVGKRVFVNVRGRRMVGYIVGLSTEKAVEEVHPIEAVIDERPILSPQMMKLTRWMADHYFCGWGQAIEASMPAPFKKGRFHMKSRGKKTVRDTETGHAEDLALTPAQKAAHATALAALRSGDPATFLLYGITGSGKTEIYLQLIGELLRMGKGAIMLVPEISLTPQTVDRFHARFGDCLAVIHSRLPQGKRVEEWHRIRAGAARVVVGARSAIFSPVKDLGLIVIDEEHDTSYKQDETPRYQTRAVAEKRAEIENAVLMLGSATPSLESFYRSEKRGIVRLELPERIERRPLPVVDIVDMRRQGGGHPGAVFSSRLEEALRDCFAKGEQAMLLLNRRGFSTHLHCAACGYVAQCDHCRVSLVYHYDKAALYCHLCEFRTAPPKICPQCQKHPLHYFGMGTQKVETEARKIFAQARIGRMDADSTARQDSHETILRAFRRREIDLLIGTQMIAKGHDFPHVSLIGVISADTALHIPDFRSAERTFDLLTQVAGRAGRGDIPGRVIVQTFVPHHYSIQSAKDHDYREFYDKEILYREELGMPPVSELVRVVLAGPSEAEAARQAMVLARGVEGAAAGSGVRLSGPAPCITSKEKGEYRWNFFLKAPRAEDALAVLRRVLKDFKKGRGSLIVDVDPQ